MNLFEYAQIWVNVGIAVIPIRYKDKRPLARLLPDGKWEYYKTNLPTDTELQAWFASSLRNLGVVVGWNNLVVIDFDNLGVYNKWLLWTARKGDYTEYIARHTYRVQTARGVHVYVYTKGPELNRKLAGVDIKAQGGYVLAPPSVHPRGAVYTAINPSRGILSIDVLSDILPADLLATGAHNTEFANPGIAAVLMRRQVVDDPWESAVQVPDPTQDMIRQIRARNSILSYLPDAERTSRDGRWWRAKCPFHADKAPSFWIDVQRGVCGCFSGCTGKPLDAINLHARLHGISNLEAIYDLLKGWH